MKTSQQFKTNVKQHGPEEAWHDLVYYLIAHYGLLPVLRHIQWIDAATDAVVSKTETTED